VDWNDLRFFLAVHRERTLAGAARTLGVEHTTVSRRLSALESALGAKLFVRTPDGFAPTKAGKEILAHAVRAEEAMQGIQRAVQGDDAHPEGVVRITTSEAFAGFVVRMLGELRARHPGITVEVVADNAPLDLARRDADIALRIHPEAQPELVSRKMAHAGWSIYAAQAYVDARGKPEPCTNLKGHDVVGFDASLRGVPGARWLEAHSAGANVVLRGNSIPAVLNAMIAGLGVGSVPCFLATNEPTLVRLTPEVTGARDMVLLVHPDLVKVARVRAVFDFLVEAFARNAALLEGKA
jgi:DNA-binding transcriptional LysR family regulator